MARSGSSKRFSLYTDLPRYEEELGTHLRCYEIPQFTHICRRGPFPSEGVAPWLADDHLPDLMADNIMDEETHWDFELPGAKRVEIAIRYRRCMSRFGAS